MKWKWRRIGSSDVAAAFIFFALAFTITLVVRDFVNNRAVLLVGLAFSLLLATVLYILGVGRSRAVRLAEEISAELHVKEERTAALLDSIGDGVVATDGTGKIIFLNQAATDMLQWKMGDAVGKTLNELVAAETERGVSVPTEQRTISQVIKSGKLVKTAYRYSRKDGSKFLASSVANPVIIDGVIMGVILTFRDITKEREIELAKTEFVSLASHQLRTPLATANWYAEILLSGDVVRPLPEQIKYLKEIQEANRRMTELINALLNVSRIELGTFAYNPEPADLEKIVDDVASDLRLKIKAKKLNFVKDIQLKDNTVVLDIRNMEIILQNLLSNAIKYTPSGGTVSIKARRENSHLNLSVMDTGFGIPREQQSRIFEKFFRADNIREKETEGTGLGLYIVKALVLRMGGQINFESIENQGTTFNVKMPLLNKK
jgi:two-component system sensor histidine kinase VicK